MSNFFEYIDNFKVNFFKSYLKNVFAYCDYYQSKIDYNYIFSDSELRILYKLLFNKYFKDKKILEIGCGAGQLSIFLNLNGIKTDAVECNADYTTLCRLISKDFNVGFKIYEKLFYNLPYSVFNQYDCIVSADCINDFNNDLNISLLPFKYYKKLVFVNGTSFADNTSPENRMKAASFFIDQKYRSLKLLNTLSKNK